MTKYFELVCLKYKDNSDSTCRLLLFFVEYHSVSIFPKMLVCKICQKLKQCNWLILGHSNYCLLEVLVLTSCCSVFSVGTGIVCCEWYSLCVNVCT